MTSLYHVIRVRPTPIDVIVGHCTLALPLHSLSLIQQAVPTAVVRVQMHFHFRAFYKIVPGGAFIQRRRFPPFYCRVIGTDGLHFLLPSQLYNSYSENNVLLFENIHSLKMKLIRGLFSSFCFRGRNVYEKISKTIEIVFSLKWNHHNPKSYFFSYFSVCED